MCKYCGLENVNEQLGEFTTDIVIDGIEDGCEMFEAIMNRYIVEKRGIHRSSLMLELSVKTGDNVYTVKTKNINIKYCPFCGEEL